jgi:cytochrome c-L
MRLFLALLIVFVLPVSAFSIEFLNALTNKPLEFKYRTSQTLTEAVTEFHETGQNPYAGQQAAIDAGEEIYKQYCQACHLKDGTGRIGPNLTDEKWKRDRTDTEIGRFEIIYGGGAGAMQAFGRRIDQDEILKVMAYIDTFRESK